MTADLIARCILLAVLVAAMVMEWRFLKAASFFPAEIISLGTESNESRASNDGNNVIEVQAHVVHVRLDAGETDGRTAKIRVPESEWKTMEPGTTITVAGLRSLPPGVFWSPMVRLPDDRQNPWRLFLSIAAVMGGIIFVTNGWRHVLT